MTRRMKAVRRDAIRAQGDSGEAALPRGRAKSPEADVSGYPRTAEGEVVGDHFEPPKRTLARRIREIVRILRS